MPQAVEDCVDSVMDERDVSESSAYAICWSQYNSGELKEDDDYEWGPYTGDDEESLEGEEKWEADSENYERLLEIVDSLPKGDLDGRSLWAVGVCTLAAEQAQLEDPRAVKSVAYRTISSKWGNIHPAEKTKASRDHLWETYKYAVNNILGKGEVGKTLSKSRNMEKVDFTAEFAGSQTVFKADDEFIIWGPASVEIVDKEGDRIHAEALEESLPQLLKRGRLSLEHSDQLVGEIIENFELEHPVEVDVDGQTFEREIFPTDVLELNGMEPALYVCGKIYNDTRQSKRVREAIEEGRLNSYSISGEALVSRSKIEEGEPVNDIVELDLSAVTVCEEGMNQRAKFATVTKGEADEEPERGVLTVDTKAGGLTVAKAGDDPDNTRRATDNQQIRIIKNNTMSDDDNSEESPQEVTMDELTEEFSSVVKETLAEEDLAKEEDILTREEVQEMVEESVEEKMDALDQESEDDVGKDDEASDDSEPETLTREDVQDIVAEQTEEAAKSAAQEVLETLKEDEEDEEEEEEKGEYEDDEEEDEEESMDSKQMDEDELADLLADVADVTVGEAMEAIDNLQSKQEDEEEMEEDEMDEEKQEEDMEDEEEDEDEKEDEMEDDDEDDEDEKGEGSHQYTISELKEKLPEDVFDAVRGYIGEKSDSSVEEKSDDDNPLDIDLNKAVEQAVEEKFSTASSPEAPSGSTEKSYDGEEESEGEVNPALALWEDR